MFCVSVKVKLTVVFLCVCVHSAWKGRPQNDLHSVGWDDKPHSLTHPPWKLFSLILKRVYAFLSMQEEKKYSMKM